MSTFSQRQASVGLRRAVSGAGIGSTWRWEPRGDGARVHHGSGVYTDFSRREIAEEAAAARAEERAEDKEGQ